MTTYLSSNVTSTQGSTTLGGAINASVATVPVSDASKLPATSAGQFVAKIYNPATPTTFELILVTANAAGSGAGNLTATRGYAGTSGLSWTGTETIEVELDQTLIGNLLQLSPTAVQSGSVFTSGQIASQTGIGIGSASTPPQSTLVGITHVLTISGLSGVSGHQYVSNKIANTVTQAGSQAQTYVSYSEQSVHNGSGTIQQMTGFQWNPGVQPASGGVVNTLYGLDLLPTISGAASTSVTTYIGVYVETPSLTTTTITTQVGIAVDAQSNSANGVGIRVGIGGSAGNAIWLTDTGGTASGGIAFGGSAGSGEVEVYRSGSGELTYTSTKNFFGGTTRPTAVVHLAAGTATAGTAPLKIVSGTLMATPEAGAIENDGTTPYWTTAQAKRRSVRTATGAIASATGSLTTSETVVATLAAPVGDLTAAGRMFRIRIFGRYSNSTSTAGSMTVRLRLGGVAGTVIYNTGPVTTALAGTQTNTPFHLDFTGTVRTTGTSAVFQINALFFVSSTSGTGPTALVTSPEYQTAGKTANLTTLADVVATILTSASTISVIVDQVDIDVW